MVLTFSWCCNHDRDPVPDIFITRNKTLRPQAATSLLPPLATMNLLSVSMDVPFFRYMQPYESSNVSIVTYLSKTRRDSKGHIQLLSCGVTFARSIMFIQCSPVSCTKRLCLTCVATKIKSWNIFLAPVKKGCT